MRENETVSKQQRSSIKHKCKNGFNSVSNKFRDFDDFGEAPSMKINDGDDQLRSYCGAFLSFVLIGVTLVFLYSKAMVLIKGTDVTIIGNYAEGAYTYEDTFTAEDGLFIGAALTEYDSNPEIIEEKRYGELVIEYYGWGYEGEIGVQ